MNFLEKTISELSKAQTVAQLARHCRAGLTKIGISHVTYALVKQGRAFSDAVVSSTYPKEWQARYIERSYAALDPVLVSCRHSVLPVIWSHVRPASVEGGLILKEAGDYGISRTGCSVPVRGPDGAFAIVSYSAADQYEDLFNDLTSLSGLVFIAFHMHAQAATMLGLNEIKAALTARETEVVALIASGMTVKQASEALSLSVRTIRFHLDSCREKLGTGTIRGAVVKAVSMGLVRAGEKF
jgi:LuxR family transcriptional regulator